MGCGTSNSIDVAPPVKPRIVPIGISFFDRKFSLYLFIETTNALQDAYFDIYMPKKKPIFNQKFNISLSGESEKDKKFICK